MNSNSAFDFLTSKWRLTTDRLDKLEEEWARLPPMNQQPRLARMHKAQRLIDERENLMFLRRRIESYLGNDARKIDSRYVEFAKYVDVVRWVRVSIQSGESDEFMAAWLMGEFPSSDARHKRGRSKGTVDHDGHALLAVMLHDSVPRMWTYRKLADRLLGCMAHKVHTSDSDCTGKLKKAVERLRKFLRELGYEQTVT